MIHLKKILFPTDFSRCAQQALDFALFMAEQYGAELHMLHAIVLHEEDPHNPVHHFPDLEEIHKRLAKLARESMSESIQSHKHRDIDIKMVQQRGIFPAEVILPYAEKNSIDLIVMGTHGRRGLRHFFLGSVTEDVVRRSKAPVLTVREQEKPLKPEEMEHILVPIDFSGHAKMALSHAKEIAKKSKAKLQLLHVVEETVHPAFYASGKTSIFEFIPDIKEKSEEAMQKMLKEVSGSKLEAEFHVVEGRADYDIVEFAQDKNTDLIVIATHGLSGIEHFLIGSVTEKVVRRAPCPVLTVKSFGKSLVA